MTPTESSPCEWPCEVCLDNQQISLLFITEHFPTNEQKTAWLSDEHVTLLRDWTVSRFWLVIRETSLWTTGNDKNECRKCQLPFTLCYVCVDVLWNVFHDVDDWPSQKWVIFHLTVFCHAGQGSIPCEVNCYVLFIYDGVTLVASPCKRCSMCYLKTSLKTVVSVVCWGRDLVLASVCVRPGGTNQNFCGLFIVVCNNPLLWLTLSCWEENIYILLHMET